MQRIDLAMKLVNKCDLMVLENWKAKILNYTLLK